MKNIVAEIVEVLKSSKDTIELEQRVHKKLGEFSCEILSKALGLLDNELWREYSGTLVKTKIDKFLNVSGSRHCSIEQQCREVALCWRDVPDG